MPSRRKCSIERALVLLHLGCCAVSSRSFTRIAGMPRQPSSMAALNPTGPPPAIRTHVWSSMLIVAFRKRLDQRRVRAAVEMDVLSRHEAGEGAAQECAGGAELLRIAE